jgi:hypothetical protein
LNDGRTLALRANVLPPRPGASLIAKSVMLPRAAEPAKIRLEGDSELPLGGTLTFSLRSSSPHGFAANERVEIASQDGTFSTTLTLAQGQLKRVGASVIIASLDPVKEFGAAAFGPLQFRVAVGEFTGNWTPLITLIRVPDLTLLKCAAVEESACSLSGSDLYLVEAVARGPAFEDAVQVPEGFPGHSLLVPHPGDGGLYLKLRDNPATVHPVALPISVAEAARPPE